jgi:hypothetical protein
MTSRRRRSRRRHLANPTGCPRRRPSHPNWASRNPNVKCRATWSWASSCRCDLP